MKNRVLKRLKAMAKKLPNPNPNNKKQSISWKANYRKLKRMYKSEKHLFKE